MQKRGSSGGGRVEWANVFTESIYYANKHGSSPCSFAFLTLLNSTSQTLDGLVYASGNRASIVPPCARVHHTILDTIDAPVLRHKIVGHSLSPSLFTFTSGATRHKEPEICVNQKDIKEEVSQQDKDEECRTYWPVPGLSSMRIGECAGIENVRKDELPGLPSVSNRQSPSRSSMSVSTFFELKNDRCTAAACVLGALSDNTRGFLTLHTDSMWNCGTSACCGKVSSLFGNSLIRGRSVQRIRRDVREEEGTQLGVYLRRQSSVNPIPSLSIPSDRFRLGNGQTTSHIHASFRHLL